MTALPKKPRRTQKERREATIQKLIDATIASLLTAGYNGTTVKEICARAGLSHGALFRFFPSVLDLVLASSEEVARLQIADFERRFLRAKKGKDPIAAALRLVRDACRSPMNAVFYELLLAARTHPKLKKALKGPMERYYDAIRRSARTIPGLEKMPEDLFDVLLFSVLQLFDGESLDRSVLPMPEMEAKRLELLTTVIRFALGSLGSLGS